MKNNSFIAQVFSAIVTTVVCGGLSVAGYIIFKDIASAIPVRTWRFLGAHSVRPQKLPN